MNNGYRLSPAGLLVKPNVLAEVADEAYLPANHYLDTIPMSTVESSSEIELWGEGNMPTPQALTAAVHRAREAVALQESDELRAAKSPADVREDLAQARRHRDAYREFENRVYQDRLAELDAQRAHQRVLARHDRKRNEDVAEARQRLGQLLDPTSALIRLNKARLWAPMVALLPAIFGVAAGAVNVGSELMRLNPATWLINWVIEPLFTLPILAILIAQIAGAVPSVAEAASLKDGLREALRNRYVRVEIGLFALAVVLNVAPHFAGPGAEGNTGALVWAVVPVGLAVSMYLVPKLLADLTAKFVAAKTTLPAQPDGRPSTAINLREHAAASGLADEDQKVLHDALEAISTGALDADPTGYAIYRRVMGGRGDKARAYRVADVLRAATNSTHPTTES